MFSKKQCEHCDFAADYEALERRLEESESERIYYKDRLKPAFDYVDGVAVSIAEDEVDRLERRLAEAREWIRRLIETREQAYKDLGSCQDGWKKAITQLAEVEVQLAVADKGLLKASDPNSGWQGIKKECKLWQERAEKAEAENKRLREELQNIIDMPIMYEDQVTDSLRAIAKAALRREG